MTARLIILLSLLLTSLAWAGPRWITRGGSVKSINPSIKLGLKWDGYSNAAAPTGYCVYLAPYSTMAKPQRSSVTVFSNISGLRVRLAAYPDRSWIALTAWNHQGESSYSNLVRLEPAGSSANGRVMFLQR